MTEPINLSTRTSRTSSPSGTPPPNDEEKKDIDDNHTTPTPFGYGINEEKAVTPKFHNHHYQRNREHLTQSIHTLHKLQHSASTGSADRDSFVSNNPLLTIPASKVSSKYKMDVISCQVIIFHNIHKLSKAMQSIVIQIMKMKSIPVPEHCISHQKSSPSHQLCICTRQNNKFIPYLLRDMCLIDYVVHQKNQYKNYINLLDSI